MRRTLRKWLPMLSSTPKPRRIKLRSSLGSSGNLPSRARPLTHLSLPRSSKRRLMQRNRLHLDSSKRYVYLRMVCFSSKQNKMLTSRLAQVYEKRNAENNASPSSESSESTSESTEGDKEKKD